MHKILSTSKHLCHTDNTMFRFNQLFLRDLADLHQIIQVYSDSTPIRRDLARIHKFFGGISPHVKKPCTLSLRLLHFLHSIPTTFGSPAHLVSFSFSDCALKSLSCDFSGEISQEFPWISFSDLFGGISLKFSCVLFSSLFSRISLFSSCFYPSFPSFM